MAKLFQQVALKEVRFFAYHGYYPEEQLIGSVFFVDLEVCFQNQSALGDQLANTVNYETLFSIAAQEMKKTAKLIETVAQRMLERVQSEFTGLKEIRVVIRKMHPPLAGEVGHSQIVLKWSR